MSAHAWLSLHLSSRVFLPSCSSTARPQPRAKLACPPKCCLRNTRDRHSTPAPCRPVHATDLLGLRPSPRMLPSVPKPAHPAFPRLCAHPAHTAPHPYPCLTPPLSRSPTRILPHLEHSATAPAKTDACVVGLTASSHLAELVTSLTIPMYPFAHGKSFKLGATLDARYRGAHTPRIRR